MITMGIHDSNTLYFKGKVDSGGHKFYIKQFVDVSEGELSEGQYKKIVELLEVFVRRISYEAARAR